jgi:hypothetical protein
MDYQDTAARTASLLDKLSPNWREAESCADVANHEIRVNLNETEGGDE